MRSSPESNMGRAALTGLALLGATEVAGCHSEPQFGKAQDGVSQEVWDAGHQAFITSVGALKKGSMRDLDEYKNGPKAAECYVAEADLVKPLESDNREAGVSAGGIALGATLRCDGVGGITQIKTLVTCDEPITRNVDDRVVLTGCKKTKEDKGMHVKATGKGGLSINADVTDKATEAQIVKGLYELEKESKLSKAGKHAPPEVVQRWIKELAAVYMHEIEQVEAGDGAEATKTGNKLCKPDSISAPGFVTYEGARVHEILVKGTCPPVFGTLDLLNVCTDYQAAKARKGGEQKFQFCFAKDTEPATMGDPSKASLKGTTGTGFNLDQKLFTPKQYQYSDETGDVKPISTDADAGAPLTPDKDVDVNPSQLGGGDRLADFTAANCKISTTTKDHTPTEDTASVKVDCANLQGEAVTVVVKHDKERLGIDFHGIDPNSPTKDRICTGVLIDGKAKKDGSLGNLPKVRCYTEDITNPSASPTPSPAPAELSAPFDSACKFIWVAEAQGAKAVCSGFQEKDLSWGTKGPQGYPVTVVGIKAGITINCTGATVNLPPQGERGNDKDLNGGKSQKVTCAPAGNEKK